MIDFLHKLFTSDFMPHGTCYLWRPGVLWLHVISDGLIAASYYAIPFLLVSFTRRRRDLGFHWIFIAFALFIFTCGTTHLMSVWTVWHATYRLEGVVKAITALASVATAAMLVPLVPVLVALPSPSQLRVVNRALEKEVEERKAAEQQVTRMNATLERRIQERTAELEAGYQELRDSSDRYRFLAEAMPEMVWTALPDGRRDYFNQRWYEYTGASFEESRDWGWTAMIHPDDLERGMQHWRQSVAEGTSFNLEIRIRRHDGAYRWHRGRAIPRRNQHGQIVQWVGTSTDIDDLKRANQELRDEMERRQSLEQQLTQAQKMEAVGRLAGGIAHDFNNLLTGILGFSELLVDEAGPQPRLQDYAHEIQKAAGRASALTNQLLVFSRRQAAQPRLVNLNRVVANIERMLRRIIGEDIELVTELAPALADVRIDPGQADQVIMNLAVNARDAMPGGGRLTIQTANVQLGEEDMGRHIGVAPGPYVVLSITDSGIGMDAAVRNRLFEPFFTTKEVGQGTGLGLSIVYGIVKQSGGDIWVYSEPGKGSTFRIYLPRAEAEPAHETPAAEMPAGGSETVLLVEDEEVVRRFTRTILERLGYRVLEAAGAAEALEITARHQGDIHLLLTDVVMPEINGPELAQRLKAARPGLRTLFMSGYPFSHITKQGLLAADTPHIQKPFTVAALNRKIREILS